MIRTDQSRDSFITPWRDPRPRLARGAVLLLLFTVVLAQFAATQHEVTTQHAICAEHGELIDVDNGSARSATRRSASVPSGATNFSTEAASERQSHHQHCFFVASRDRRNAAVLARVAGIEFSRVSRFTPLPQSEISHRHAAIYRSAPKHSPPSI